MNKKLKLKIIIISFCALLIWDLILVIAKSKGQQIDFWWAGGFALLSIVYGLLGLVTAKHWSWLHSKVGQGVFFISLGTVMWGVGQAGWTYYAFKFPNQEYQPARILDILFFSSIPLWFYGVLKLTKATGAEFGLKKLNGKLLVLALSIVMIVFSYYLLVIVARGGSSYFKQPLWSQFFDLGYSVGDAIIFTMAIAIFGLSWKYLGGKFKNPILTILFSFGILYFADTIFNYRSLKNTYYNGDISDILYFVAIATLSFAICMLDPSNPKAKNVIEEKSSVSPVYNNQPSLQNESVASKDISFAGDQNNNSVQGGNN